MCLAVTFGSLVTIIRQIQLQSIEAIRIDGHNEQPIQLQHPYLQFLFVNIAKILSLLFGKLAGYLGRSQQQNSIKAAKLATIPTFLESITTGLIVISLTMCRANVYLIIEGFATMITALISVLFLKNKQGFGQWVAIVLITAGFCLVGIFASEMDGDAESTNTTPYFLEYHAQYQSDQTYKFGLFLLVSS